MDHIEDTRIYVVGQDRQRDQGHGDGHDQHAGVESIDHTVADVGDEIVSNTLSQEADHIDVEDQVVSSEREIEPIEIDELADIDGTDDRGRMEADEITEAADTDETSAWITDDEAEAVGEQQEWNEAEGADVEGDSADLSRVIEELCMSKAEEFTLLGYESITGKEIWEFVSERYEQTGIPPLHRLINDILSLRVTQYMNWLTLSAYKGIKFHE